MLDVTMGSRRARIFLLAFIVVWFGAIVPGHQRRLVVLGPTSSSKATPDADHCTKPGCHKPMPAGSEAPLNGQDAPGKQGTCAVCYLASTIEPATAPDIAPRPTATALLEEWAAPRSATVIPAPCFDARGPPA